MQETNEYTALLHIKGGIETSLNIEFKDGIRYFREKERYLADSICCTIDFLIDTVPELIEEDNYSMEEDASYFYIRGAAAGLIGLEQYTNGQEFTEEELKELNATKEYCVEVLKKHLYLYEEDIHDSLPGEERAGILFQAMTALGYPEDAAVELCNQLQKHYETKIVGQEPITSIETSEVKGKDAAEQKQVVSEAPVVASEAPSTDAKKEIVPEVANKDVVEQKVPSTDTKKEVIHKVENKENAIYTDTKKEIVPEAANKEIASERKLAVPTTRYADKEIQRREEQKPGPSGKGCGSCRVM